MSISCHLSIGSDYRLGDLGRTALQSKLGYKFRIRNYTYFEIIYSTIVTSRFASPTFPLRWAGHVKFRVRNANSESAIFNNLFFFIKVRLYVRVWQVRSHGYRCVNHRRSSQRRVHGFHDSKAVHVELDRSVGLFI
jgi:hypothetical protein